jgi:cytochrome c1
LFLLLFAASANAQLSEKQLKELHDNTAKIESTSVKLNEAMNASMHVTDSLNMVRFNEQNSRNLDAFLAQRKEQKKKDMQRMYWRLGFGLMMLVVLIIGWKRKKKQQVTA